MSTHSYQQSTEHLTARIPKLTREQALREIRIPATGLIVVASLALALTIGSFVVTAGISAAQMLFGTGTEAAYEAPDPSETREERLARKKLETRLKAEGSVLAMAIAFVAVMTVVLMNAVILVGSLKMRKLQSRGWSSAAAAFAIIPLLSPLVVAGIPFGIWAMIKMANPEVKRYFIR
jgi:hypothetical protein